MELLFFRDVVVPDFDDGDALGDEESPLEGKGWLFDGVEGALALAAVPLVEGASTFGTSAGFETAGTSTPLLLASRSSIFASVKGAAATTASAAGTGSETAAVSGLTDSDAVTTGAADLGSSTATVGSGTASGTGALGCTSSTAGGGEGASETRMPGLASPEDSVGGTKGKPST